MRSPSILLCAAAAIMIMPVLANSGAEMRVKADVAVVTVKPLPGGRRLVRLPALEFALLIEPQCAPDTQVDSISISVADTKTTLTAGDMDGQSEVVAKIAIPRRQVSPLAIEGFCQLGRNDESNQSEMLIEDAFTASISLRCAGEHNTVIAYASKALDLKLRCVHEEGETEAPPDQGAPSSSIAR